MDVVETANFTLATHQLKLTGSWEDREALKRDIQDICDTIEEGVTVADYERKSKAAMNDHGSDHDRGSDAVTIAVIVAGLLFIAYEGLTIVVRVHRLARVYRNSNLLYCLYSSCIPSIAHRRSQYLKRPSVRRELLDVYRHIGRYCYRCIA